MNVEAIGELHHITPLRNLDSILTSGIRSPASLGFQYSSGMGDDSIGERRSIYWVPNGKLLNEHVYLYFNPRTLLIFRHVSEWRAHARKNLVQGENAYFDLIVLRVSVEVLKRRGYMSHAGTQVVSVQSLEVLTS